MGMGPLGFLASNRAEVWEKRVYLSCRNSSAVGSVVSSKIRRGDWGLPWCIFTEKEIVPYIGSGIDWYRLITAMNRDKISVMCSIVQEIGAGINPLALAHPFVPGAAPATR